MRIYTRRGDLGESGILSGERLSKDDLRFQAVGALDELQSHLGVARALTGFPRLNSILCSIQKNLFVAGSELASTRRSLPSLSRRLGAEDVGHIETWIDELSELYGLPGRFVAPGRSLASAAMHVVRSVCRRCERHIVALNTQESGAYSDLTPYFNRLSDLFFVMAWCLEMREIVTEALRDVLTGTVEGGSSL